MLTHISEITITVANRIPTTTWLQLPWYMSERFVCSEFLVYFLVSHPFFCSPLSCVIILIIGLFWNRVSKVIGFNPPELLGKSMFEFFHPEDRAHMRESFEQGNFDNRNNSLQSRINKLIISIGSCYIKFLPFEPSMILAVLPFEIIVLTKSQLCWILWRRWI